MAGKEIVCVQNTLKIMRFYGILPEKGREFNPGKNYYCKLVIMASFGAVVLIGSFLHLLKNMSSRYFFIYYNFSYLNKILLSCNILKFFF